MHPDIGQEIALTNEYVAALEAEVNGWRLIPRIPYRFPFDSISLETISKAFAISKACLVLLQSGFPDEAFGLARSLVECALNLRFLTADRERLFERSMKFVSFSKADMQLWLHYTVERKRGTPDEQIVRDFAKDKGIGEPDARLAFRHWSGTEKQFVFNAILCDHALDNAVRDKTYKLSSNIADYYLPSTFVHCSQPGLENYFPDTSTPFRVSSSSGKHRMTGKNVLFLVLVYLFEVIAYARYGMNLEVSPGIERIVEETLMKLKPLPLA